MHKRYLLTLPLALISTRAFADTEIAVEDRPTEIYNAVETYDPHQAHARCHTWFWYLYSECAAIRDTEIANHRAAGTSGTQQAIVDWDGTHKVGRRELYPASSVKLLTGESTFSAKAWITRYTPAFPLTTAGTSAHPEWENRSIQSCDDYAYKRYYQPNRHLDALGTLTAAKRYGDAIKVVVEGAPAIGSAKQLAPATGTLTDYEGRQITIFRDTFDGGPLAGLEAPKNQNPFFGLARNLIESVPLQGAAWEADLDAALDLAGTRSYDATKDTWEYANQMRTNPAITGLSAAERDDAAERIERMRKATRTAIRTFERCTTETFRAQTGSTSQLPIGQTFEQYVRAITDGGDIDPVDWNELVLVSRLVDDLQWSGTLSGVVTSPFSAKTIFGTYARTRMGKLLRGLSTLNATALQTTIGVNKTSFKSGTWSPCNGAFYEVARLLVEEYRRGATGCMSSTSQRCEFSMPVFVNDVATQLARHVKDVDDAKALCVRYLTDNWAVNTIPTLERSRLDWFELYFQNRKRKLDEIRRNTPVNSTLPDAIGDRRAGGTYWGDRTRFGAGYTYDATWAVNVVDTAKDGETPCQLGGEIEGSLRAWVTLFGRDQNLVDAGLRAHTLQNDSTVPLSEHAADFDAHVTLLGIDVFPRITNAALPANFTEDNDDSFDVPLVRTTIILGFIPVTIEAGFGFDYGYVLKATFSKTTGCVADPKLKLTGSVVPRAGAEAYVSAYVDLFVLGAGVKGTLTLIEAKLPFDNALVVTTEPGTTSPAVDVSSELRLELTELSGSIAFIVKVIGITVWEKELFRWPGIKQEIPLWKTDVLFPFATFNLL